jgi:biopolymer transport protein ExbD
MRIPTGENGDRDAVVNLTPLIDVVFLLLIFFMVTARFQEDERDLAVTLPEAEHGETLEDLPETIFINVRRDGTFTMGAELLDRDSLGRLLRRAKRQNPRQKVIIRADHEVAMRHPVVILDLCTGLGIETSLATAELGAR